MTSYAPQLGPACPACYMIAVSGGVPFPRWSRLCAQAVHRGLKDNPDHHQVDMEFARAAMQLQGRTCTDCGRESRLPLCAECYRNRGIARRTKAAEAWGTEQDELADEKRGA